jgi:hypothetical protein
VGDKTINNDPRTFCTVTIKNMIEWHIKNDDIKT